MLSPIVVILKWFSSHKECQVTVSGVLNNFGDGSSYFAWLIYRVS